MTNNIQDDSSFASTVPFFKGLQIFDKKGKEAMLCAPSPPLKASHHLKKLTDAMDKHATAPFSIKLAT